MARKKPRALVKTERRASSNEPLIESDRVPDIFIDGYRGASVVNGVITFNCYRVQFPASGQGGAAALTVRLGMSLETFGEVATALAQLRDRLVQDSVLSKKPDTK